MRKFYLLISAISFATSLMAQLPDVFDISVRYLETDNNGNFYGASGDKIISFDSDGNIFDTITVDFNEPFATMTDFRIGLDGEMYVLYDFNNGIYQVNSSGLLTKVLDGSYRYFDVDENGGILASRENGGEQILRYSSVDLDTIIILDDNINASNLVFDVQIAPENTFWISYAKGLLSYKNAVLTRHNENSINDIFVGKDDRIYVTFDIDRAGYKEPNEDEITEIDFNDAVGRDICGDSNGRIFVSDNNIVYIFSNGIWSSVEISDNVFINTFDFAINNDNDVAMSSNGKIYIWKSISTKTVENNYEASVSIFPNPSSDFIAISSKNIQFSDNSHYNIISSSGAVVKTGYLEANQIEVKNLASGTYFLHLEEMKSKLMFIKN